MYKELGIFCHSIINHYSDNSINMLFTIINNTNNTVIQVSVSVTVKTVTDTVIVDPFAPLDLDPSW